MTMMIISRYVGCVIFFFKFKKKENWEKERAKFSDSCSSFSLSLSLSLFLSFFLSRGRHSPTSYGSSIRNFMRFPHFLRSNPSKRHGNNNWDCGKT